jgi:hypothetical protein
MKTVRLLRGGLKIISLFTFGLCLLSGWMFYVFYLKWISLFENGRYFDPKEEVVYDESSFIWVILSLFLLLVSALLWVLATKIKRQEQGG